MAPVQQFVEAGAAPSASQGKHYLFNALIHRINQPSQQLLRWRLIVTVGQSADPTNDATIVWPVNREHVDAGNSQHQSYRARRPWLAAISTTTRWFFPRASRRLMIHCSARDRPPIHNPLRDELAKPKGPSEVTPAEVRQRARASE
jgi:catalase